MTASIVGWAHTPFGKLDAETVESLVVKVATEAMADAGISAEDVDEIVLGHFNAGFSAQDFTASLVLQASPDLRRIRKLQGASSETPTTSPNCGLSRCQPMPAPGRYSLIKTCSKASGGRSNASPILCRTGSRNVGTGGASTTSRRE